MEIDVKKYVFKGALKEAIKNTTQKKVLRPKWCNERQSIRTRPMIFVSSNKKQVETISKRVSAKKTSPKRKTLYT